MAVLSVIVAEYILLYFSIDLNCKIYYATDRAEFLFDFISHAHSSVHYIFMLFFEPEIGIFVETMSSANL